ncbi:MAG: LysE family transporter [candidate division WOR-3 bacterium]
MHELLFKVSIVSLSGALAPGPLTAATATLGLRRSWKSGLLVGLGHTIVELPYLILLALGVSAAFKHSLFHRTFGILGGLFLFYFGFSTMEKALRLNEKIKEPPLRRIEQPILTGIFLTLFNPYFFTWWLGIGASLISEALAKRGFFGVGLLYLSHVWLDYAWLIFIARIAALGRLNTKIFRALLIILASLLIYFGGKGLWQFLY